LHDLFLAARVRDQQSAPQDLSTNELAIVNDLGVNGHYLGNICLYRLRRLGELSLTLKQRFVVGVLQSEHLSEGARLFRMLPGFWVARFAECQGAVVGCLGPLLLPIGLLPPTWVFLAFWRHLVLWILLVFPLGSRHFLWLDECVRRVFEGMGPLLGREAILIPDILEQSGWDLLLDLWWFLLAESEPVDADLLGLLFELLAGLVKVLKRSVGIMPLDGVGFELETIKEGVKHLFPINEIGDAQERGKEVVLRSLVEPIELVKHPLQCVDSEQVLGEVNF
jgi:hypothetical protein